MLYGTRWEAGGGQMLISQETSRKVQNEISQSSEFLTGNGEQIYGIFG